MNGVVGDLLPLALGVAISPVPIIAVILMLFAPRAGSTSKGFLAGWIVGITVAVVLFVLLTGVFELGSNSDPSTGVSWFRILLGLVVMVLAVRQWQTRPQGSEEAPMPGWMSAIDTFTPAKAAGLGFLLSAVNPKNLVMCAAAGVAIAGGNLSAGGTSLAVVIFVILAACTIAIPVIAYGAAAARMRGPLEELKHWLQQNNSTVMAVLLLVIGVVLIGKGLGGL